MTVGALASLMLAVAAPQGAADLPGLYLTDQMEMAGALELQPNGHFRYQFDYGAASEVAEGDWSTDGASVSLTSNPMPKEPAFSLVRDDPAPAGELYVAVEDSRFGTWTPLSVVITADGIPEPFGLYAEDDGRVTVPEGHRATSVKMLLPVYETGGDAVRLSADRGHRLLFRIEPNDMGKAPFHGERLGIRGSALVMHRYDAEIIFHRSEQ